MPIRNKSECRSEKPAVYNEKRWCFKIVAVNCENEEHRGKFFIKSCCKYEDFRRNRYKTLSIKAVVNTKMKGTVSRG
jgi:hypothetical protein